MARPKVTQRTESHNYLHLKRVVQLIEGSNFSEAVYIQYQSQLHGNYLLSENVGQKFALFISHVVAEMDRVLPLTQNYKDAKLEDFSLLVREIKDFCNRWEINRTALFSQNRQKYAKIVEILRGKSSFDEEHYTFMVKSLADFRTICTKKIVINQYMYDGENKTISKYNEDYWSNYYENNRSLLLEKAAKRYNKNKKQH